MGLLVEGKWKDEWYDTKSTEGRFVRHESAFRGRVSGDGSTPFKAEPGRYHLYVSLACPWAHRSLIFRALKKLEGVITLSIVDPFMGDRGWAFSEGPGCIPDEVRRGVPPSGLHEGKTRLYGACYRARSLGSGVGDDCEQRVGGDHPDAEPRFQCLWRREL